MADPNMVACTADSWTKVATNVTDGFVRIKDSKPEYLQTYRMTGQPAPANLDDAVKFDEPGAPICASAGIDVYIQPLGDNGLVRVDV